MIVATVRALKYNGGVAKADLGAENVEAVKTGLVNLQAHVENMKKYGVPVVVAINRFGTDTDAELKIISDYCEQAGADFALSEVFAKGGEGGIELAKKVVEACEKPADFHPIYDVESSIEDKVTTIAKEIYGADGVTFSAKAKKAIKEINALGASNLPICVAKTQYSLSDNQKLLGRPKGFNITIRDMKLCSGAGFIVAYAGDIMTMPGLPKVPTACSIDIDENGTITGLF